MGRVSQSLHSSFFLLNCAPSALSAILRAFMQHDIIDNRERKLAASVKPLLSESEKAKFAVGYFFISGFKFIADELEKISELRLLIGNVSDSHTVEQLAESHSAAQLLERTRKREFANQKEREAAVDEASMAIRARIEQLSQTDEDERVISLLVKLIEEKRFVIRVYTKSRLHAKAYIFDYSTERYDRGMAIIGSSNLSLSGLVDNTELNVEVHGKGNHEQLTKWFNDLWAEAEDFDAELMRELRSSWALNAITPFELYVKILFELVRDRLEHPLQSMPSDFPPLTDFQWAAVQSALRILKKQNGVILADVVGFGKTLMGTALLKWLYARERWRALIICPKQLRPMWQKYSDDYGLRAKILTLGQIRSPGFDWTVLEDFEPRIALVDESHNFRHSDTEQYRRIAGDKGYLRARGLPVICITATPRNRLAKDVYNQIALFHPEDQIDLGLTPPSLSKYFQLIKKHERELPPLLQYFMVRRTRRHIREHWPNAQINGQKIIFPDRKLTTIRYNINKVYDGLYDHLRRLIEPPDPDIKKTDGLRYARYGLIDYVDQSMRSKDPYRDLARAGLRLSGLMRSLLFKRFESSVEAFRCTVSHLLESHRLFLTLLDEGKISAGEDVEPLLKDLEEGDAEDEELLESLRAASGKYDSANFDRKRLREDIESDVETLKEIKDTVDPITPERDAKLQKLMAWLDDQPLLRQHKLLIFTQFSDTGEYLYENLREKYRSLEFWIDSDLLREWCVLADGDDVGREIFRKDARLPKMDVDEKTNEFWYGIWSRGAGPIYYIGFHTSCSGNEPLSLSLQVSVEGDRSAQVMAETLKDSFNERNSGKEGNRTNFVFTKTITAGEDNSAAIEGWLINTLRDVKRWVDDLLKRQDSKTKSKA